MATQNNALPMLGKIYYNIPIRLASPLIIGCGADENSDVDVVREMPSEKPIIPATSLLGVFRNYIENDCRHKKCEHKPFRSECPWCQMKLLFGDRESAGTQSALQCEDIILEGYAIRLRDGVKINHATQTAEPAHKYNYEVVEGDQVDDTGRNASFNVILEITLREPHNPGLCQDMIASILQAIGQGEIRLGAKTNKGFGRLEQAGKVLWRYLKLDNPKDIWEWLNGEIVYKELINPTSNLMNVKSNSFSIDACFAIKNSLLIRSYPTKPDEPDAIYIKQNGKPTLPGTSVMGAIRHRARKILLTRSNGKDVDAQVDDLFGIVPLTESNGTTKIEQKKCKRGKVRVEEHIINLSPIDEVQTRIKIDRFTGGTIAGALLEEMPLWQNDNTAPVRITITIPNTCEDKNACLLLLILKDLWTGDLAIGGTKNIGRGVLLGKKATVIWDGVTYMLKSDTADFINNNDDFIKLNAKFTEKWKNDQN